MVNKYERFLKIKKEDINEETLDFIFTDSILTYEAINKDLIQKEYFHLIPEKYFTSQMFSSLMMKQYSPPINKIPPYFFQDEMFLIEIANNALFNIKHVPPEYFTQSFLSWLITNKVDEKNFLSFIPKELVNEDIGLISCNKTYKNFQFLPKNLQEKPSFIKKLNKNIHSKIFSKLNNNVKKEECISFNAIELDPSNFQYLVEPFNTPEYFPKLFSLNKDLFPFANDEIKSDLHCTTIAINSDIQNILYCTKINDDIEFFLSCYELVGDEISPFLHHFGKNIFSDKMCVKKILSLLIKSDKLSLIDEKLLDDKELMLETLTYSPDFFSMISEELIFDKDFFNKIVEAIQNLCIKEPEKYSLFELQRKLFLNLPESALSDYHFMINLYEINKNNFLGDVFPYITHKNSFIIQEILEVKRQNLSFDDYFNNLKHMFSLQEKMDKANLLKPKIERDLSLKKI